MAGLPPYFIRNGTGGNEWIADPTPAEDQALNYEILPFDEMDGLVNPRRGWIANANQDPTGQTFDNDPLNELRPGGGIRYITPGPLRRQPERADHVTGSRSVLDDGNRMTFEEMQSIQADVKLNDAEVLVPYIDGGAQRGAGARRARGRWRRSAPTPRCRRRSPGSPPGTSPRRPGIAEGYDATDTDGNRRDADAGRDRRERRNDDLLASGAVARWRCSSTRRSQARGLGSFLPGGDQAMSALRHMLEGSGTGAVRHRVLLERCGSRHEAPAGGEEHPRPGGGLRLHHRLRRVRGPGRLPLGQAAPDHVPALARRSVQLCRPVAASRTSTRRSRVWRPTAASESSTRRRTTHALRP